MHPATAPSLTTTVHLITLLKDGNPANDHGGIMDPIRAQSEILIDRDASDLANLTGRAIHRKLIRHAIRNAISRNSARVSVEDVSTAAAELELAAECQAATGVVMVDEGRGFTP